MTDVGELIDVLKGNNTVSKSDQSALMTLRHLIQDVRWNLAVSDTQIMTYVAILSFQYQYKKEVEQCTHQ
jgi:hypothetical protein